MVAAEAIDSLRYSEQVVLDGEQKREVLAWVVMSVGQMG